MALTQVKTSGIAADAIDGTKIADGAVANEHIAVDAVNPTQMAHGTDGNLITYDTNGAPGFVTTGNDGQVLTSQGAGNVPQFEDLPASGPTLTGSTNNTICTVTGANAIQGEANLTFDGDELQIHHATDPEIHLNINTHGDAAKIKADSDGMHLTGNGSSNQIRFKTNDTERFRLTGDGRYIQGHTSSIATWGGGLNHQLHGTSWDASSQSQVRWSNDGNSSSFIFGKSRGGIGTQTIVADNDNVGQIAWVASDGTDFNNDVARIDCLIDGTPGSNVVPGELVFSTTKSTGQSYTNMKIRNDGNVEVSNGNVVIGTAGKGIDFSATANSDGTMTSETLSDYEEGTWTPYLQRYQNALSAISYGYQYGAYTRIGNVVYAQFDVDIDSWSGGSGSWRMSGLPFTPVAGISAAGYGAVQLRSHSFLSNAFLAGANCSYYTADNGGSIYFTYFDTNNNESPESSMKSDGRITGFATYYV